MALEPGRWKIGIDHCRLVVQQRAQGVLAGTQFDPGDILQASDLAVGAGTNDDVLELFLVHQATLGVDRELESLGVGRWRCTQGAGRHLAGSVHGSR